MDNNHIKLGVSLFSLSNDFYLYNYSLEECIKNVSEIGSEGIEIVAAQMIPGYPWPSDTFIETFKEMCLKYNVQQVCYSGHLDRGLRSDRDLNEVEAIESIRNDIICTHKIGCEILRTQFTITPKILEKMIPYAEAYNVRIGVEMHAPHSFTTPIWIEFFELFEKYNTKYIGVIPDFGIFQERPNELFIKLYLERGVSEKSVNYILNAHANNIPKDVVLDYIKKYDPLPITEEMVETIYSTCKHADMQGLKKAIPYTIHMHSKFFYIDENFTEKSIPYNMIFSTLKDAGYVGYLISEYEGHYYDEKVDCLEQVKRHLKMERNLLNNV